MSNSLPSSSHSGNNKLARYLANAILVLALLGLADATYLAVTHYTGGEVSCSVLKGCEQVLSSKYSSVYGVSLAVFGTAYYAALFLLMYYYRLEASRIALRLFQVLISLGVIMTAGLVYLQLGVIHSICQYCMISAILTTIIAILAVALTFRNKSEHESNKTPNQ